MLEVERWTFSLASLPRLGLKPCLPSARKALRVAVVCGITPSDRPLTSHTRGEAGKEPCFRALAWQIKAPSWRF